MKYAGYQKKVKNQGVLWLGHTECSDAFRITAETRNVFLDPLESVPNVEHGVVARRLAVSFIVRDEILSNSIQSISHSQKDIVIRRGH